MSRVDWMSFSQMRGDDQPRAWMRWSELLAAVAAEFPALRWWDVREIVRPIPAERHYGHKHYTTEHLKAVRAYAAARGLTTKGVG